MNKAHYVIFHPDFARQEILVQAKIIEDEKLNPNWRGKIFVDAIGNGNEDPFVFNEKWLYSYCHASQLRRKPSSNVYLQHGSYLFFVSGNDANNGTLAVDTVFVIGDCHKWQKPLYVPFKFRKCYENTASDLWSKHFKFPFEGHHASVTHTYEAKMWSKEDEEFSFLPVDVNGSKVKVKFNLLSENLANRIQVKVKGKYPVLLSEIEKDSLMESIMGQTGIQVIGGIRLTKLSQSGSKAAC